MLVILIHVRSLLLIIAQNISLLLIHSSWLLSSGGRFRASDYLSLLVACRCNLLFSILCSKLFSAPLLRITLITLEFLELVMTTSFIGAYLSSNLVRVILEKKLCHFLLSLLVLYRTCVALVSSREILILGRLVFLHHGHRIFLLLHFLAFRVGDCKVLHCKSSGIHEDRRLLEVLASTSSSSL